MSDLGESDSPRLSPDDEPTEPEITVPMRVLVKRPVEKRTHASVDLDMAAHSIDRGTETFAALFRDFHRMTMSERDLAYARAIGELDLAKRTVAAVKGRLP